MNRRRTVAIVVVATAALALGWTSTRVWGPAVFGSERPSIRIHHGSGADDSAVVQRDSSIVRTFVGDKPSPSRNLLAALGLTAIAAAAFWTRRRTEDRWTRRPLHPLRGTIALRAPPSSRLF
jgi:MYXO-CTERM domain-containing protein